MPWKPELDALEPPVRSALSARARARMRGAGAHHVIDSVADLLPCIADIESKMSRGERP